MKFKTLFSLSSVVMMSLSSSLVFAQTSDTTTTPAPTAPTVEQVNTNPMIADPYIVATVQAKFKNDPTLSKINVTSNNGTVTLDGSVDTQEQADSAVSMVKTISGVSDVKSNLQVKAAPGAMPSSAPNAQTTKPQETPTTSAPQSY